MLPLTSLLSSFCFSSMLVDIGSQMALWSSYMPWKGGYRQLKANVGDTCDRFMQHYLLAPFTPAVGESLASFYKI